HFGKSDVQHTAESRLKEQLTADEAMQHESRRNSPVAPHLTQPVVLLRAKIHGHLHEIIGAGWPKRCEPALARLAHFGLTPEIVELQNQACFLDHRLFRHSFFLRVTCDVQFYL